jgi:hypothetical protein
MDTKTCLVCGKKFSKPKTYSRKRWETRTYYCSRACFGQDYSRRFRKQPDRECQTCGAMFRPRHFAAKYCSQGCAKDRFVGRQGEKHWAWKGGRHVDSHGYVHVLLKDNHPYEQMRHNNRYILEHRLVMAEHLGRPLERHETIHHINGDRADNRLKNLQLRQGRHGKGCKRVCADCGSERFIEIPL